MNDSAARELLELNRRFYHEFGNAFAATRRRVQPGVRRVLEGIPVDEASDWLISAAGPARSAAFGRSRDAAVRIPGWISAVRC